MASRLCKLAGCPRSVTHKIVFNPVGEPRVTEYYCEEHAEVVAEKAREGKYGDIFLGPVEIGE